MKASTAQRHISHPTRSPSLPHLASSCCGQLCRSVRRRRNLCNSQSRYSPCRSNSPCGGTRNIRLRHSHERLIWTRDLIDAITSGVLTCTFIASKQPAAQSSAKASSCSHCRGPRRREASLRDVSTNHTKVSPTPCKSAACERMWWCQHVSTDIRKPLATATAETFDARGSRMATERSTRPTMGNLTIHEIEPLRLRRRANHAQSLFKADVDAATCSRARSALSTRVFSLWGPWTK